MFRLKIIIKQWAFIGCFLFSLLLYVLAPNCYDYDFNIICIVLYFANVFIYYSLAKKNNYFDFDILFVITYFFVMLFYPVFIYPIDPTRYFAFQYEFNENVISKASALSVIGISSYFMGSLVCPKRKNYIKGGYIICTNLIFSITILSFVLYIFSGGYRDLINLYSGKESTGGIGGYFFVLTVSGVLAMIIIWFNNINLSKKFDYLNYFIPKREIILVLLFSMMILFTGSRTVPMQIALLVIGLYTFYFHPFSLRKTVVVILGGLIAMFVVVVLRSNGEIEYNSISDILMDLIINNRNTYVAIDYVDRNGLSYGTSMLAYLLSPIPMMQQLIESIFDIDSSSLASARIITVETIGYLGDLGMGTNIIADEYMAFGTIGVVLLMFILGYIIKLSQTRGRYNIYYLSIYVILLSYAVYLVRAEYLFPLRYLVWTLTIVNLSKFHSIKFRLRR